MIYVEHFHFTDIEQYSTWTTISKINKGWSFDEKFYIKDSNNIEFILRLSNIDKYNQKKEEFDSVIKFYSLGLSMSKPISFGVCNEGQLVYSLLSYIPGEQAEIVLPTLSKEKQYSLGFEMGRQLKKLHSLDVVEESNWEQDYTKKINSRIAGYRNCGIKNKYIDEMIVYVLNNLHLLKDRPTCLSHGDFHSGNIIITPDNDAYIIDFNRVKHGDPLYEFNRIFFSHRISKEFARGQVQGYFNNEVPDYFFEFLKFYTLSVIIGNISWASGYEQSDIDFAVESLEIIYKEYNAIETVIPNWYEAN